MTDREAEARDLWSRQMPARAALGAAIKQAAEEGHIGPAMHLCGMTEEVVVRAMLAYAATARQSAIEEAARAIQLRIDLYRTKRERHDPAAPDSCTEYEKVTHTIEGLGVLLHEVRQLGSDGEVG